MADLPVTKTICTEEFLKASDEERIALLNAVDGPVILTGVTSVGEFPVPSDHTNYDWYFWHSGLSPFFKIPKNLMIEKYVHIHGICNSKPISKIYSIESLAYDCYNIEKIQQLVSHYQNRGWLTSDLVRQFAVNCFSFGDFAHRRPSSFCYYVLDLCQKYHITAQELWRTLPIVSHYNAAPPEGILVLMEAYLKEARQELDLVKQEISNYMATYMSVGCNTSLFDFCINNGIRIVSNMYALQQMITHLDLKRVHRAVDLYKEANCYVPDEEFLSVLILIDPTEITGRDKNKIGQKVFDSVLFQGSPTLIRKLMDMGLSTEQKIYELYVPCWKCHNGEQYSCNFRYVTSDYVTRSRFGYSLTELMDMEPSSLQSMTGDTFWMTDGMCLGKADSHEVYVSPGQNELQWNEDTNQRIYETPPQIERLENPITKYITAPNPIPHFFIPLINS